MLTGDGDTVTGCSGPLFLGARAVVLQAKRAMTNASALRSSVTINAPISKVWQAITTPSEIKKWFFGVDTKTDWKVGGPIVHTGTWQGKPYTDKGTILAFEPTQLLAHTHWSAMSGLADQPQNYQEVRWELSESNGSTELTVSEDHFADDQMRERSEKSWRMVLDKLKEQLEK
jgi:uncharacterized protein YndB with AHSA1/START domain